VHAPIGAQRLTFDDSGLSARAEGPRSICATRVSGICGVILNSSASSPTGAVAKRRHKSLRSRLYSRLARSHGMLAIATILVLLVPGGLIAAIAFAAARGRLRSLRRG